MKNIAIAFPFVLLMDVIMFVSFLMWQHESVYEFEQRQLDLQVNYAIDAATQEMLENSSHLSTDYANWGSMVVEPEVALDTYLAVLLRNFGWADTERSREQLLDASVPFFTVATYDGYYIYCKQRDTIVTDGVQNKVYTHKWTPKIPYTDVEMKVDGSGNPYPVYYLYNLGDTTYGTYVNNKLKLDNNYVSSGSNVYATYSHSRLVIADILTEASTTALYSALEGKTDVEWIIPNSFSQWSNSRPIDRPSVLTYISRADNSIMYDTVTFGIGGSKIDDANFCILYYRDGQPVYTYADRRSLVEAAGIKIQSVVPSPKDAADKGFYYDLTFME